MQEALLPLLVAVASILEALLEAIRLLSASLLWCSLAEFSIPPMYKYGSHMKRVQSLVKKPWMTVSKALGAEYKIHYP